MTTRTRIEPEGPRPAGAPGRGADVPEWTLYTLRAEQVEFWQADKNRKRTRLRYGRSSAGNWTTQLLWP